MWEMEKEMFIQSLFKNNNYVVSERNYLYDYSIREPKKIDMSLSGKYLSNYGKIENFMKSFDEYPSSIEIKNLKNAIQKKEKTKQKIILGAGANGILQNLVKIFFSNKGNLVTTYYTFNQVEFAVTSFGGKTHRVYMNNFRIDFLKLEKSINKNTRMVYICNPNNLTGIYEKSDDILKFARKINIPIVVDESGIEFTGHRSLLEYSNIPSNLLVVRSFSKAYGIANLRIGYLACNEEFEKIYTRNVTTNEFSGLACMIANNLIKNNEENVKENVMNIVNERENMIHELDKVKIRCLPSESNIIMTKSDFNDAFLEVLDKNDIAVVPIYDEFDNIHLRIAIQSQVINRKFINILKDILKS